MREAQEQREREQEKAWETGKTRATATTAAVQVPREQAWETGKTRPTATTAAARVPREPHPHPAEPVELSTFVRIHLKEIHSDLRGVKWYYDKKVGLVWCGLGWHPKKIVIHHRLRSQTTITITTQTGVVKEHDRGLADIRIHGKGMSIELDVEPYLPVATAEKPLAHTIGKPARWIVLVCCRIW